MAQSETLRTQKNAKHPFVMISRTLTEDNTLSLEACGLMAYLLGKPDNWQVRIQDLLHRTGHGITHLRRILRELKEHGYLERERIRVPGHSGFEWISTVHESPIEIVSPVITPTDTKPIVRKPIDRKPADVLDNESNNIIPNDEIHHSLPDGSALQNQPEDSSSVQTDSSSSDNTRELGLEEEHSLAVEKTLPTPLVTARHPTIQLVREIMRRYPNGALYEKIVTALGDDVDVPRLKDCYVEWCARGFKPTNFAWLFDWYKEGIPKHGVGKAAKQTSIGRREG